MAQIRDLSPVGDLKMLREVLFHEAKGAGNLTSLGGQCESMEMLYITVGSFGQ